MSFIVSNTYDIHATASLDLQFASKKNLIDQISGSNLVDFTRASSGTYVDSEGVIRQATTNLLLQSEDFSTTWTRTGVQAFGSGSTVNAIAAPNGTITADLITEDSSASAQHAVFQTVTTASGATVTVSCYAKAAERNHIRIIVYDNASLSNNFLCFFEINNGTVATPVTGGTGVQNGVSIVNVGGGWYRCTLTGSVPNATTYQARINIASNTTTATYTGDGTSGIYLWGAQLEQSTTVGEYIPTTSTINSAPRFDHDPTTGESLGLLVEESRTNLLLNSEFQSNWTNFNTSTVTPDAAVSPNGTTTAAMISSNDTTDYSYQIPVTSIGTIYTFSFFIKAGTSTRNHWHIRTSNTVAFGQINWSNGELTSLDVSTGSATFKDAGNGWYRIAVVYTATETGARHRIGAGDNTSTTGSAYIWGAQLEAGSFPTSYIPTTDAAATRAADVASISGSNFSSWYRQDEGTVFNLYSHIGAVGSNNGLFNMHKSSSPNTDRHTIRAGTYAVTVGGVTQATGSYAIPSAGTLGRLAYAYKADDIALIRPVDQSVLTDSSATLPLDVNTFEIGKVEGTALQLNGHIRRLTYWPTRLPDETLQTITQ